MTQEYNGEMVLVFQDKIQTIGIFFNKYLAYVLYLKETQSV